MPVDFSRTGRWAQEALESVPVCPLCGSPDREPLHSGLQDYFLEAAPGSWDIFRCGKCHSAYLDPRPNVRAIALAYRNYYTHQVIKAASGGLRRIWYGLRNDYLQANFGAHFGCAIWPGRWLLSLFPNVRQGVETGIARNLEKSGRGRRLLDIGCGNGSFLAFARAAGWEVTGLDFDPEAVKAARSQGLDVIEGGIESLSGEEACFDRITLSHVIEHVFEPWDLLARCHRLLKPGGTLWLELPNIESVGHGVFGAFWRGLEPPRHLQLPSRACLKEKMADIGFADIQDRFSSLATKGMWQESRLIMDKAGAPTDWRHSPVGRWLLAEVRAPFSPGLREFITLTATKKTN